MIFKSAGTVIAASFLMSMPAMAADKLGYSYLEADYTILDIDAFDDDEGLIEDFDDGDGWAVRGSVAFTDNWSMFGAFSKTDSDFTFFDDDNFLITGDTDVERLSVGVSFNTMLSQSETGQTDLVVRGAYTDIDYGDFAFGASAGDDSLGDLDDDSSDGWFADVGLRSHGREPRPTRAWPPPRPRRRR
jgi:hypothetical protein